MMEVDKLSLRDIDIIVSYREANEERRENLYAVLRQLAQTYVDYRLWLLEADITPRFEWRRAGDSKLRHVFMHHQGPFPKSRLYNTGVQLSQGPVICFHDADSMAYPPTMRTCVDALLDGHDSDALCPYWSVVNVTGALRQSFMERPNRTLFESIDLEHLPADASVLYANANGGIVFFRRTDYVRVGGYDPRFEGWGGEDDELLQRASRLGVRWHSFHSPLIHLNHDSASRAELIAGTRESGNSKAAVAVAQMPDEELAARARELAAFFEPGR